MAIAFLRIAKVGPGTTGGSWPAIIGSTPTVNFTLQSARVSETITVTSEAPTVEVTNTQIGTTIQSEQIKNLPVVGTDFRQLVLLTPESRFDSERGNISLSGQRGINTNVTVDGVDYNNAFFGGTTGGAEGRAPLSISEESIKEFSVITNGASAEFGRSGGGFVNVITKSGTNNLHGSGFYYNQPQSLISDFAKGRLAPGQTRPAGFTTEPAERSGGAAAQVSALRREAQPVAEADVRGAPSLLPPEARGAQLAEHRLELPGEDARRGDPVVALALEAGVDDVAEPRREPRPALGDRIAIRAQDADHQRVVVRRLVRERPGERLVHDDAQRPEIGAPVEVVAPRRLLGRHVGGRADDAARVGQREAVLLLEHLADPEVEDLPDELAQVVAVHVNVRGLQVAVNDPLLVGDVERPREADEDLHQRLWLDGALPPQPLVEPLPDEQLEHEERRAVLGLTEVEDLDDAGAPHAPARRRLVAEALERDGVLGHLGAHHLERHVAIDELVLRSPHRPAGASAQELHEPVARLDKIAGVHCYAKVFPGRGGLTPRPTSETGRRITRRPGERYRAP